MAGQTSQTLSPNAPADKLRFELLLMLPALHLPVDRTRHGSESLGEVKLFPQGLTTVIAYTIEPVHGGQLLAITSYHTIYELQLQQAQSHWHTIPLFRFVLCGLSGHNTMYVEE